ncbi:hypothetical protein V2J09_023227 [Rumex salicifolius]
MAIKSLRSSSAKISCVFMLLLYLAVVSAHVILRDGNVISVIPDPDEKVFNVLTYGAKPDGTSNIAQNLRKAWREACEHTGKARLLIPAGEFMTSQAHFVGPCRGIRPMVVHVAGTLKPYKYTGTRYPSPEWIQFQHQNGLVILGGGSGTLDGQGHLLWHHNDCKLNHNCTRLPSSIVINKMRNVWIRGLNSVNPMGFHMFISGSKNVRIYKVKLIAPGTSPNTDGIHISSSDNVKVASTTIQTGDDCIGILPGSTRISVRKLSCGPGHGISIGSLGKYEGEEDVIGIRVKNCTLTGTQNGLRIKTYQFKPDVVPIRAAGFSFKNIVMDNVKNPIIINQEYCGSTSHCKGRPSKIRISDIYFSNIMGTSSTEEAITVMCSSAVPCRNVHFHNVTLSGLNGQAATATCSNAKVALSGNQLPPMNCRIQTHHVHL